MPLPLAIPIATMLGSAIASIFGAKKQSSAAGMAADAQVASVKEALDYLEKSFGLEKGYFEKQEQLYNQQRGDIEPYYRAGTDTLLELRDLIKPGGDLSRDFTAADFQKDPGYDFRLAEGEKGLERSAAARGNLLSGAQLKAATRYGQDFASNEFQKSYDRFNDDRTRRFNRLAQLAGIGERSVDRLGQAAGQFSGAIGDISRGARTYGLAGSDLLTQAGNARASGYIGRANAWGTLPQNLMSSVKGGLLLNDLLKKPGG